VFFKQPYPKLESLKKEVVKGESKACEAQIRFFVDSLSIAHLPAK